MECIRCRLSQVGEMAKLFFESFDWIRGSFQAMGDVLNLFLEGLNSICFMLSSMGERVNSFLECLYCLLYVATNGLDVLGFGTFGFDQFVVGPCC